MEDEWNKRIQVRQEEMKEGLWCFMYIKGKTEEKYKETFELWRERNPMTRM